MIEPTGTPAAVIAAYKPHDGQADALLAALRKQGPLLRGEGLITDRPSLLLRSQEDGTIVEIFEWVSEEAAEDAHENEAVQDLWDAIAEIGDIVRFGELEEARVPMPHFDVVR